MHRICGTTVKKIVVLDAVGRWKHEMFAAWKFGDLLLLKPRDFRVHWREVKGNRRARAREIEQGVWEQNIPMPPGWLFPLMPLSARILAGAIRRFVGTDPYALVLTLPHYHRVLDCLPSGNRIAAYYAYDDYAENWPAKIAETEAAERSMANKADLILCAARHRLQEFADTPSSKAGRLHQLPVAAPDKWLAELAGESGSPIPFSNLPSPRFVSFGALTWRVDFCYFEAVARRFPNGSVILAGALPQENADHTKWWAQAQSCLSLPNVHCIGWVAESDRAALLKSADVFLMAHAACRFNLGSCPAKLWDYFGVGKPVVATANCPEVLEFPDLVHVGHDPTAYAEAAATALQEQSPSLRQSRREVASQRSCINVAKQLQGILGSLQTAKAMDNGHAACGG